MSVLGYDEQDSNGLFYICDDGRTVSGSPPPTHDKNIVAMMAKVVRSTRRTVTSSPLKKFRLQTNRQNLCRLHQRNSLPIKDVNLSLNQGKLPHASCKSVYCEIRLKGKHCRSFDASLTKSESIGTLHVDTKVKVDVKSTKGHNYFVTSVEEYSDFVAVRMIKYKYQSSDMLLRFVRFFERQNGQNIKNVHTTGVLNSPVRSTNSTARE